LHGSWIQEVCTEQYSLYRFDNVVNGLLLLVYVFSTPAPGYFNDDDVPDFLVHWQYGPGFPIYYHSVVRTFVFCNALDLLTIV